MIKKRLAIFTFEYFLIVFVTRMIFFKSLEELISSEEVSQGSIVLGIFNETSAEMGNTFCDLVTEGCEVDQEIGGKMMRERMED